MIGNEYTDYITLLLKGDLPTFVFNEKRFIKLQPLLQALVFLKEKGREPPYLASDVSTIAAKKYNANDNLLRMIDEASTTKTNGIVLSAVKERMIVEKLLEDLTQQLATGTFSPSLIQRYLDRAGTDATPYVKGVEKPVGPTMVEFITRSGIRALDTIIGGFGAELWIVSARIKTGKSHFLLNIAARQPASIPVLYVTVADYGWHELNWILNTIDPTTYKAKKDSIKIADMTSFSASVHDVESAIKQYHPRMCIVDRAEKLSPIRYHADSKRQEVGEIYEFLRQAAKKHNCTMIADAQYSSEGAQYLRSSKVMTSEFMSEDKTQRQAVMDGWVGLQRLAVDEDGGKVNGWRAFLEGRRPGKLPDVVDIYTNELGVVK